MANTIKYCINLKMKPICLKRGTAEYWMLYVAAGVLDICMNGDRCLVREGQVAVIEFNPQDTMIVPRGSVEFYCSELGTNDVSDAVRQSLAMIKEEGSIRVITLGKQQERVHLLFQEMEVEENRTPALLMELLVRLYRASMKSHLGTYRNSDECINRICMYLNKEYAQPLNLSEIAALYNMSASYLSHIFKTAMGVSIMQYVLSRRIAVACHYLEDTPIPIKDVAEKSGFNNVSNFGRTFKKETGFTPRQYRLSHNRRPEKMET